MSIEHSRSRPFESSIWLTFFGPILVQHLATSYWFPFLSWRFALLLVKLKLEISWRVPFKCRLFFNIGSYLPSVSQCVFFLSYGHQPKESHRTLINVGLLCVQFWVASATPSCVAWPILLRCIKRRSSGISSLTGARALWEASVQ